MRSRWHVLAWFWTAVILALCWIPTSQMPVSESRGLLFIPHLDKVVHSGIFVGFSWLWLHALGWARWPRVLGWGVVLAAVSELGQLVPALNRDANIPDAIADLGGILVGIGLFRLTARLFATRQVSAAQAGAETTS